MALEERPYRIIPAPTVLLLLSSITMKAPVALGLLTSSGRAGC